MEEIGDLVRYRSGWSGGYAIASYRRGRFCVLGPQTTPMKEKGGGAAISITRGWERNNYEAAVTRLLNTRGGEKERARLDHPEIN